MNRLNVGRWHWPLDEIKLFKHRLQFSYEARDLFGAKAIRRGVPRLAVADCECFPMNMQDSIVSSSWPNVREVLSLPAYSMKEQRSYGPSRPK